MAPLECPDARLVLALCRAGALGVLDLGRDRAAAQRALAESLLLTLELGRASANDASAASHRLLIEELEHDITRSARAPRARPRTYRAIRPRRLRR